MHLWSLGIEEQYYLFFPILLLLLWRCRQKHIFVSIFIICFISFGFSEVKLNKDVSVAFFYLHSRAWELGVGSLVALLGFAQFRPRFWINAGYASRQILAIFGLALVLFAVFFFDETTRFPGGAALIPTLGAALILLYGTQETWVGKLLGIRPLVGIGLISYSAYLWHQPVFAFARYQSTTPLNTATLLALILLTTSVAYLSWRFVEAPFRRKGIVSRKSVGLFSTAGILVCGFVALVINLNDGFPGRYPAQLASAFDPPKVKEGKFCNFKNIPGFEDLDACEFGDPDAKFTTLLYGDSHASALLGELDIEFKRRGIKGYRVRLLKCNHTIPGMISGEITSHNEEAARRCSANFENFVLFLKEKADAVIVSVRWTSKMFPVMGLVDDPAFDNGEGGVEYRKNPKLHYAYSAGDGWSTDGGAKRNAVWNFLDALVGTTKNVVAVYPVPEVGWDLPRYNFSTYLQEGSVKRDLSTSYERYLQRNRFILDVLEDKRAGQIFRVKPESFFCGNPDGMRCMIQRDGQAFYYDSNHLASEGARPLALEIGKILSSE